jgi:hypothetical protein
MHFAVTYREGEDPHARINTQLISARSDDDAKRIAAEVCRGGRYNGHVRRVIVKIEAVN